MDSQLITAPDIVNDERTSVLLIEPSEMNLELTVDACRNFTAPFNVYLAKSDSDQEWLAKLLGTVDKVFNAKTEFDEIFQYLKTVDDKQRQDNML
jgi:hypothetical protein